MMLCHGAVRASSRPVYELRLIHSLPGKSHYIIVGDQFVFGQLVQAKGLGTQRSVEVVVVQ
jgi:hypothetical protein